MKKTNIFPNQSLGNQGNSSCLSVNNETAAKGIRGVLYMDINDGGGGGGGGTFVFLVTSSQKQKENVCKTQFYSATRPNTHSLWRRRVEVAVWVSADSSIRAATTAKPLICPVHRSLVKCTERNRRGLAAAGGCTPDWLILPINKLWGRR